VELSFQIIFADKSEIMISLRPEHYIDEIQAADIAVEWVRELLELSDIRSLGSQFERVWVNGKRIK